MPPNVFVNGAQITGMHANCGPSPVMPPPMQPPQILRPRKRIAYQSHLNYPRNGKIARIRRNGLIRRQVLKRALKKVTAKRSNQMNSLQSNEQTP